MSRKLWTLITLPVTVLVLTIAMLMGARAAGSALMSSQGAIHHVDDDSCPAAGSGTQVDPYCSIQGAADAASAGDEIRVAEGRYTGSQTVAWARGGGDPYTYTQVVFVSKGLTLTGGFHPADWETSRPADNPTVIDAEGHGRGISIVDPDDPVTIDGFTITGGDYTGLGNQAGAGYSVCGEGEGVDCGGGSTPAMRF